jgi:hypothetical protein
LIYNFPFYRLDHFSSKIWRKTGSNRAKQNPNRAVAPGVRAHARRRARGHAGPNRRLTGHDRRNTPVTAGPKAFHRRSHPTLHRHAPHAHGPRETDLRRSANGVAAVPGPRAHVAALSIVLRPCRDPHRDWPQRGAQATPQPPRAIHKSRSFFTRVSTKPPPSAIGAVPVSSLRRAIPVPQARLNLPPAPRVLARPRVVLVVPPARRITVPGGRPIAAADELHHPRDPRANQPPHHI